MVQPHAPLRPSISDVGSLYAAGSNGWEGVPTTAESVFIAGALIPRARSGDGGFISHGCVGVLVGGHVPIPGHRAGGRGVTHAVVSRDERSPFVSSSLTEGGSALCFDAIVPGGTAETPCAVWVFFRTIRCDFDWFWFWFWF